MLPIMANARMHDVVGGWRSLRYSLKTGDDVAFNFKDSFSDSELITYASTHCLSGNRFLQELSGL